MESAAVLYARIPAAALDLSLEAARDCFSWSEDNLDENVDQHVLRRLFAADQELLQVGDKPAHILRAHNAAVAADAGSQLDRAVCISLNILRTIAHHVAACASGCTSYHVACQATVCWQIVVGKQAYTHTCSEVC